MKVKREDKSAKPDGLKGLLGNTNIDNKNSYYANKGHKQRREHTNYNNNGYHKERFYNNNKHYSGNNTYYNKENKSKNFTTPKFTNSSGKDINNDQEIKRDEGNQYAYDIKQQNYSNYNGNNRSGNGNYYKKYNGNNSYNNSYSNEVQSKTEYKGLGSMMKNIYDENSKIKAPNKSYNDSSLVNTYYEKKDKNNSNNNNNNTYTNNQEIENEENQKEDIPKFNFINSQRKSNDTQEQFADLKLQDDLFLSKLKKLNEAGNTGINVVHNEYPNEKDKDEKNLNDNEVNNNNNNNDYNTYYNNNNSNYYGYKKKSRKYYSSSNSNRYYEKEGYNDGDYYENNVYKEKNIKDEDDTTLQSNQRPTKKTTGEGKKDKKVKEEPVTKKVEKKEEDKFAATKIPITTAKNLSSLLG